MSHVRKLFQSPPGNRLNESPPSTLTAPKIVVSPPELSDLLTVEAEIRPANRLVSYTDPQGPAADRFRYLRMRLREMAKAGGLKSILVTSPLPHDGKSTLVLNLATTLCKQGECAVLVIEADLHHASLTKSLGLPGWAGLAECLQGEAAHFSAIRRVEPLGWYLLPAGKAHNNPTELLQTPEIGNIIQKLSARFDWILIDSPPAIPVTDALALQQHADATLVAVRAGCTPRNAVEQAVTLLGRQRILGIVLNGTQDLDRLHYKYGRYGGSAGAEHQ